MEKNLNNYLGLVVLTLMLNIDVYSNNFILRTEGGSKVCRHG